MLQRINEIREMQKKLTIRHFELDQRYSTMCINLI